MEEREDHDDRHLPVDRIAPKPDRIEPANLTSAAAEEARHQRVLAAAKRVSSKHRHVFAALAK